MRSALALAQHRCQFTGKKVEEILLIGPDLDQDDVIEAGIDKFADGVHMAVRRRPARDFLGDDLDRNVLTCCGKAFWIWEFGLHRPARHGPAKIALRRLACLVLALRAAQGHFGVARSSAASATKGIDEVGSRLGRHQAIAFFGGEAGGLWSAGRNDQRWWALGPVVEACVLKLEMLACIVVQCSGQQAANDVDSLAETLVPFA